MAGRMEGDTNAVMIDGLAVREGLDIRFLTQSRAEQVAAGLGGEIVPASPTGMIGMRMSHDGPWHRVPGVQMKLPNGTIKPIFSDCDEGIGQTRTIRSWKAVEKNGILNLTAKCHCP
jgi:hypothetical protein